MKVRKNWQQVLKAVQIDPLRSKAAGRLGKKFAGLPVAAIERFKPRRVDQLRKFGGTLNFFLSGCLLRFLQLFQIAAGVAKAVFFKTVPDNVGILFAAEIT